MATEATPGVPVEVLTALGRVVAVFGGFETQVPNFLSDLANVGDAPTIHAMVKRVPLGSLMTMLEDLMEVRTKEHANLADETRAAHRRFSALNAQRNQVVHAWWFSTHENENSEKVALGLRYPRSGKGFGGATGQFTTAAALNKLADDMLALYDDLGALVDRVTAETTTSAT